MNVDMDSTAHEDATSAAWAHQELLQSQLSSDAYQESIAIHDMVQKGRNKSPPRPGELNGMAKLTDAQVIQMRAQHSEGCISFKELGEKFNISTMTAYRAVVRQSWSHI